MKYTDEEVIDLIQFAIDTLKDAPPHLRGAYKDAFWAVSATGYNGKEPTNRWERTALAMCHPAPAATDGVKMCPGCDEFKPPAAFGKNRSKKDGLQTYCKACNKKKRQNKRG